MLRITYVKSPVLKISPNRHLLNRRRLQSSIWSGTFALCGHCPQVKHICVKNTSIHFLHFLHFLILHPYIFFRSVKVQQGQLQLVQLLLAKNADPDPGVWSQTFTCLTEVPSTKAVNIEVVSAYFRICALCPNSTLYSRTSKFLLRSL